MLTRTKEAGFTLAELIFSIVMICFAVFVVWLVIMIFPRLLDLLDALIVWLKK